jgi:predicted transposase YdaD
VEKLRRYSEQMTIKQASLKAINECIEEGVLEEFLMENKAEVIYMNIFEYNEEKVLRMTKEEGYEMGYESGAQDGELRGRILERCKDVRDGAYSMEYAAERLDIALEQFEHYYEEFVRTGKVEIESIG